MDENTNTTDALLGVADAVVMDAPTPDDGNGTRNRRPVVVAVASVAILALLAGGGYLGWKTYTSIRNWWMAMRPQPPRSPQGRWRMRRPWTRWPKS